MPRWLSPLTLAISIAGFTVATYLTIAHFASATILACSDKGFVNCAAVTTSAESTFAGIPVAVIGLVFWIAMLGLSTRLAWRAASPWVHRARLGLSIASVGFVIWLLDAEFIIIGKVCLWCTAVHLLTFVMFVLVMLYGIEPTRSSAKVS